MPIYEYRCENGHTFEVVQRMTDDALDRCEVCEAPASRVLHAPAIHFKGSGFYNTDYGTRKRARERASRDGKSSGDGGDSSSSASSDSSGAKAEAAA